MASIQEGRELRRPDRREPPRAVSPPAAGRRQRHAERRAAAAFLAPTLAIIGVITLAPGAIAVWVSLHETTFLNVGAFVGLDNFLALARNPSVRAAAVNTAVFTLGSVGVTIPLALFLAVLLNQPLPGLRYFRVVLILPWAISEIVAALSFRWLMNFRYGLLTWTTEAVTGLTVNFLGEPGSAMLALIAANAWTTYGLALVLFLAALQTVPQDVREAAFVDGASAWQRFRHVTFPLIRPVVIVAVILVSLIFVNRMALPYALTGGGPGRATDLLSLRVFEDGILNQRLDRATALSVVMVGLNLILSLFYIRALQERR